MSGLAISCFVVAVLAAGSLAYPESPYYPLYRPQWSVYYAEAFPYPPSADVPMNWFFGQLNLSAIEELSVMTTEAEWYTMDDWGWWNTDSKDSLV